MSSRESHVEEHRHRIFVGSIPGSATAKEVENYFSAFGRIERVRMFHREGTKLNKGYCHLFVDKKAYAAILSVPHHFDNRTLFTTPYISGRRLEKQNITNNSRRVIVRNLPKWFTERDLKLTFSRFGKVEVAYLFNANNRPQDTKDGVSSTGSVQFEEIRVAESMVHMRVVEIEARNKMHAIVVYPFIHNYPDLKESMQKDKVLQEDDTLARAYPGLQDQSSLASNPPLPSLALPTGDLAREFELKPRYQRKRILEVIHKYKPCRKYYYLLRTKYGPTTTAEEQFPLENLRFNRTTILQSYTNERMAPFVHSLASDPLGSSSLKTIETPRKEMRKTFTDEEHLFLPALLPREPLPSLWTIFGQEGLDPLEPVQNRRILLDSKGTAACGFGGESFRGHCPDRNLFCQEPFILPPV